MSTLGRVFGLAAAVVFVSACGGGGESGAQPPPATTHSVTTSVAGSGSGSISPTSRTVNQGSTTSFTVSPAAGSTVASVSGCGGSLSGTTYTTGAISSSCTVTATFNLNSYTVTATAGPGGSISPTSTSVQRQSTATFMVTPDAGYSISLVTGCGGTRDGSTYTTAPIATACSITASFSLNEEEATVVWTPASLYASVEPGEAKRFNVQFTASENASRLDVEVPPEISPHVAAQPTSFPDVRVGQTYQLEITVSSPTPMPVGVKEGLIRLLEAGVVRSRALPVDLTFSPIPLPPDPGAEGMATIEGVDSDGDGIRDDVQRWIVLNHPDSKVTREALKQRVLNLQEALLSADDRAQSIAIAESAGRAVECLFYLHPDAASHLLAMTKAEVLNTPERSLAFIRHNEQISGENLEQRHLSVWRSSCAFDPAGVER